MNSNSDERDSDSRRRQNNDEEKLVCDINEHSEVLEEDELEDGTIVIEGDHDFPEGSTLRVDENGMVVAVYPPHDDGSIDVNHIADEVEVDNNNGNNWMISVRQDQLVGPKKSLRATGAPSMVLMTSDSLKSHPQMFVSAGKPVMPREDQSSQWDDRVEDRVGEGHSDKPSTSSDLPSMRPLFRLYADAALRKAGQAELKNEDQRTQNDPLPNYEDEDVQIEENEVDRNAADLVPLRGSVRNQLTFNFKNWPLYWDRPIDYQEACEILCASITVDEKSICRSIPKGYKSEGTFVIDLRPLANRHEVHFDDLGVWGKPNGRVRYYSQDAQGRIVRCDDGKGRIAAGMAYVWKCMLKRYEHPVTSAVNNGADRFIKKIYTALYPPEKKTAVGLAVVTYEWMGRAFDFPVSTTSGGSKGRKPGGLLLPPQGTNGWESASFNSADKSALPATVSGYFGESPIYAVGAIDFNTAASVILGGIIVEPSKICGRVPQGYREAGTFVINIEHFPSDAELRRDNNGSWGKPAGHSRYYKLDSTTGDAVRVDSGNKLIEGATYDIQILSKRYEHPAVQGRFVRKIYTGRSVSGDRFYPTCSNLAVISYYWKGEPEWFEAGRQNQVHLPSSRLHRYPGENDLDLYDHSMSAPHVLEPAVPVPPPAKRRMMEGSSAQSSAAELEEMQAEIYKKEYQNQLRLSSILDRAESFMERLERSTSSVVYQQQEQQQVWIPGPSRNENGQQMVMEQEQYTERQEGEEEYIG